MGVTWITHNGSTTFTDSSLKQLLLNIFIIIAGSGNRSLKAIILLVLVYHVLLHLAARIRIPYHCKIKLLSLRLSLVPRLKPKSLGTRLTKTKIVRSIQFVTTGYDIKTYHI